MLISRYRSDLFQSINQICIIVNKRLGGPQKLAHGQVVKFSGGKIEILKALMEKVDNLHEMMGNFSSKDKNYVLNGNVRLKSKNHNKHKHF